MLTSLKTEGFDPTDPNLTANPYPFYEYLLKEDPLHRAKHGYWVVSRHEDVRNLLRAKTFGQGEFINNIQLFYDDGFDVLSHSSYRWLSQIFVMQDPPQHTRLRNQVVQALTARRVEAMRPRIQAITDSLIESSLKDGRMEVIHDFAYRLPTIVMFDMLGIPEEEIAGGMLEKLNQAISDSFIVFETRAFSEKELALADQQIDFLTDFFNEYFDSRRKNPKDDLMTALVASQSEEGGLTTEEASVIAIGLFGAGFETTAHMIGNGLYSLHQNPEQWDLLRKNTDLSRNVTEEVLRFEPSLQASYRTALEDTELVGKPIKKGERILALIGAAGRDPAVYEDPNRFDITRQPVKPLAFGGGIHYCVGAQLARLEGEIAFATLARRFPDMNLDIDQATWRPAFFFRGLNTLHASFSTKI